jgi:transketolase
MKQRALSSQSLPDLPLNEMANAIRILTMDAIEKCGSGHPGLPMGMADVATVLFSCFLKHSPENPLWEDRDRFILSAGHGSMLIYSVLHLLEYPEMSLEQLKSLRTLNSKTPAHPEFGHTPGVETTTGPLGQGVANAVGMALCEKKLAADYGQDLVDHYTYVILGDGCLMEGVTQEALSLAAHWNLNKLILLYDCNQITIDGKVDLSFSENVALKFQAIGFYVLEVDGHCHQDIHSALQQAQSHQDKPTVIICHTHIAYGCPEKQGTSKAHGAALGPQAVSGARAFLNWRSAVPFEIPKHLYAHWIQVSGQHQATYQAWQKRLDSSQHKENFKAQMICDTSALQKPDFAHQLLSVFTESPPLATRQAFGKILKKAWETMPYVLGGSADLAESTQTQCGLSSFSSEHIQGRFLHYGVREHAMAAIMNGIALHKGFFAYGGTFLVFSDYARPAIRLAALMKLQVFYIMTHDSIGLGEDGPTHQPIEHLASLRAIPNLFVFRPADEIEAIGCFQAALQQKNSPSLFALSRQTLPRSTSKESLSLSLNGAYILSETPCYPQSHKQKVDLWASGSEVALALQTQNLLRQEGYSSRVISAPCLDLFNQQPTSYQNSLMKTNALKAVIEAAALQGWHQYVGQEALMFGLTDFGASGAYAEIYQHYGLTPAHIVQKIKITLAEKATTV